MLKCWKYWMLKKKCKKDLSHSGWIQTSSAQISNNRSRLDQQNKDEGSPSLSATLCTPTAWQPQVLGQRLTDIKKLKFYLPQGISTCTQKINVLTYLKPKMGWMWPWNFIDTIKFLNKPFILRDSTEIHFGSLPVH